MTVGDTEDNKKLIDKTNEGAIRNISMRIRHEADDLHTNILRGFHKCEINKHFVTKEINRIKTLCEELEAHVQ